MSNLRDGKRMKIRADCVLVKGSMRFSICDMTRGDITVFAGPYYDIISLLTTNNYEQVIEGISNDEYRTKVTAFVDYLEDNEFVYFGDTNDAFSKIEMEWEYPGEIMNAIIDIDGIQHNFTSIYTSLDRLGCQFVQIRCFSNLLNLDELSNIVNLSRDTSIESVELIVKHDPGISEEQYVNFFRKHSILVSLTVHSASTSKDVLVTYDSVPDLHRQMVMKVRFLTTKITSERHCGVITLSTLNSPSFDNLIENMRYNGCLNRKISIDAFGNIKNCPSMTHSFGDIRSVRLEDVVKNSTFRAMWDVSKDQISVCKDCEFRYVCSDCRAFLEHPYDLYSKPLKCGYNPNTGLWEEWSHNPLRIAAIDHYGLHDVVG